MTQQQENEPWHPADIFAYVSLGVIYSVMATPLFYNPNKPSATIRQPVAVQRDARELEAERKRFQESGAERRYTALLSKPRSPPLLYEDPHLSARERRARQVIREREIEREFLATVDRNADLYLAPEEIMSALKRCGHQGPPGMGNINLQVYKLQDISVDRWTSTYSVSLEFAEKCVQKEIEQEKRILE